MSVGVNSVYFDACVYLAHYRQEFASYGKPRIAAIGEVILENERGGCSVMTSTLCMVEVLEILLHYGLKKEIEDFKRRLNGLHRLFDVDPVIAERAASYREWYRKNPVKMPTRTKPYTNLATPDAIHLATGIIHNCDEFWTFDGLNTTADKRESIKPLWLNNKVGSDAMIIVPPSLAAPSLPLGA